MPNPQSRTRMLQAVALILAPLLLLGARLSDITPQADTTAELLTLIAEQPTAWAMGQWFYFLSGVVWVLAGLALMRLFGPRARLGRWAGAAVAVGGITVLPVDAAGLYLTSLAASEVPLDEQVAIVEAVEGSAAVIAFEIVHICGLYLGLLVVAIALLRSRVVPAWSAWLLLVGMVGLLAAPHPVADVASVACLAVGLGVVAVRVRNMSQREWRDGAMDLRSEPAPDVAMAPVE